MAELERRCGTCKWFYEAPEALPYGECGFPTPDCFDDNDKGGVHGILHGKKCPCWEATE